MFKCLQKKSELKTDKIFNHFNNELTKERENNGSYNLEKRNMNIKLFVEKGVGKNVNIEQWNKRKEIESIKRQGSIESLSNNNLKNADYEKCNHTVEKKKKNISENEEEPCESELEIENENKRGKERSKERSKEIGRERGKERGRDTETDREQKKGGFETNMNVNGVKEEKGKGEEAKEKAKAKVEANRKSIYTECFSKREVTCEKRTTEGTNESNIPCQFIPVSCNVDKNEQQTEIEENKLKNAEKQKQENEYEKNVITELDKVTNKIEILKNASNKNYKAIELEKKINENQDRRKIGKEKNIEEEEEKEKEKEKKIEEEEEKEKEKTQSITCKRDIYTETDIYVKQQFLYEIRDRIIDDVSSNFTDEKYNEVIDNFTKLKKKNSNEKANEEYVQACKENVITLLDLFFNDFNNLLCNNLICSKRDLDRLDYVNNLKKKYVEEINSLRKKEKILSDINERHTKQLLQLSYQMSYMKTDSTCNEVNMLTEKVENMELEIKKLKEEEQKLNEMLQDKMSYMRKNFELKCYIKNLKSIIKKKSARCSTLKNENKKLKDELSIQFESSQSTKECVQDLKRELEEMKKKEHQLKVESQRLRKQCGLDSVGESEQESEQENEQESELENGQEKKEEVGKDKEGEGEEEGEREAEGKAEGDESTNEVEEQNEQTNEVKSKENGHGSQKGDKDEETDAEAVPSLNDDVVCYLSSRKNVNERKTKTNENQEQEEQREQEELQYKGVRENEAYSVSSYELILQECKSFTRKSVTNTEVQLREMKKLLSNEIKKNEMIQKKYLKLLDKFRDIKEEKSKELTNQKYYNKCNNVSYSKQFFNNTIYGRYIKCDENSRTSEDNSRIGEPEQVESEVEKEEHSVHTNLQIKYLQNEINILTKEIQMMHENQLLLQKDVNNKSKIISYLIKKHALNEERFRLDGNWNMANTKLKYEEMKKLMEETLIENIRLRTDLITLANSFEEKKEMKPNLEKEKMEKVILEREKLE